MVGGNIPTEYIGACEKGFASCMEEGAFIGAPVQGLEVVLEDGDSHAVDSSDMAFQTACRMAFRDVYNTASPVVLEPLMMVSVEGPGEMQGEVLKTIMQRRGIIVGTTEDDGFVRIDAHVPLAEMFGYANVLRSARRARPSSPWSSRATRRPRGRWPRSCARIIWKASQGKVGSSP